MPDACTMTGSHHYIDLLYRGSHHNCRQSCRYDSTHSIFLATYSTLVCLTIYLLNTIPGICERYYRVPAEPKVVYETKTVTTHSYTGIDTTSTIPVIHKVTDVLPCVREIGRPTPAAESSAEESLLPGLGAAKGDDQVPLQPAAAAEAPKRTVTSFVPAKTASTSFKGGSGTKSATIWSYGPEITSAYYH